MCVQSLWHLIWCIIIYISLMSEVLKAYNISIKDKKLGNVSNVTYVRDIRGLKYRVMWAMLLMSEKSEIVFVAFTQMCTNAQCTAYMPLNPPKRKTPLSPSPVGLVVHHKAVQGGSFELCFKTFWDSSNYKVNCRQDILPIPNS